ncbi:MAG: right-handed parallel beta-helix repeat-containing protein [Candidatus Bathyarchaeota archaeon]|nr:MAG: right-handed parallel beta-helix repeat-containing protein [Candidatus Bathyarchaeota archaeon]
MNRLRSTTLLCIALILIGLCEAVTELAVEEVVSLEHVVKVPYDFRSIQEAVDRAQEGDRVEVDPGIYLEHILVNKSVSISGTDGDNVVVDGGGVGAAFSVVGSDIHIAKFTIRNSNTGIYVKGSNLCSVSETRVEDCNYGIRVSESNNCTILENHVEESFEGYGINANASHSILIENNSVSKNHFDGIGLLGSSDCTVKGNTVSDNVLYGIWIDTSSMNTIFHNNVFRNGIQVVSTTSTNNWSSNSEGNYWADYRGVDKRDHDGIGDTPYIVDEMTGQQDEYPLMQPFINAAYLKIDTDAPTVSFTLTPQDISVNENVSFDASTCDDSVGRNSIVEYRWDFGDEAEASGITVDHSYTEAGNYTVTLIITDAAGNENGTSLVVEVHSSETELWDGGMILLGGSGVMVISVLLFIWWRRGRRSR